MPQSTAQHDQIEQNEHVIEGFRSLARPRQNFIHKAAFLDGNDSTEHDCCHCYRHNRSGRRQRNDDGITRNKSPGSRRQRQNDAADDNSHSQYVLWQLIEQNERVMEVRFVLPIDPAPKLWRIPIEEPLTPAMLLARDVETRNREEYDRRP